MPCEKCVDLCVRVAIRSPSDLRRAIEVVNQNVLDGSMVEKINLDYCNQQSFSELVKGAAWGVSLSHFFNCLSCSEAFKLHAETYHGSGGYWEPVSKHVVKDSF
jgi:hypothetical protein